MLAGSIRHGVEVLSDLTRAALGRLLRDGAAGVTGAASLFTDAERQELADTFAAVRATSDLLARSLVRDYQQRLAAKHEHAEADAAGSPLLEEIGYPRGPLPPEKAIDYFKSLVPTLNVQPGFFGQSMRRDAFTLAGATETDLLTAVQAIIRDRLETGQAIKATPAIINQLLDDAGVSTRNPQRAEMIWRTNAMDSYNTAADEERQDPDVVDTFPVWQYSNPDDSRSRPEHAEKDGLYYPASVAFRTVRGEGIEDAANCRCTSIPIDKWDWKKLHAAGARVETEW